MRECVDIIGYLFYYYDLTYWPNNVSQHIPPFKIKYNKGKV